MSFKDLMMESSVEVILRNEFNIPFKIKETNNQIQLTIFVIPFKERRKGKGTEFIQRVIELGKQYDKDIVLNADDGYLDPDDGDMNLEQLRNFYKKLGFTKQNGKQSGKFDHIYKINK